DLGGDYTFRRVQADGRIYVPFGREATLSLRSRAGAATDEVPFQKAFALGGVGSVRAFDQNAFRGTHYLLGNAELTYYEVPELGDLTLFALADAGWVGNSFDDALNRDEVIASAGFGIGLDDRSLRFEVAWPVYGAPEGAGTSILFMITPSF
ncbi:MAG: BamA/TamA family outer membrane protein, partial [Bacteroidota bacterium]